MTLDPNRYRYTLDALLPTFLRDRETPHTCCIHIALASEVPLLAVVLYALRPEVLGEIPDLRRLVPVLTDFYHYTDVSPWAVR